MNDRSSRSHSVFTIMLTQTCVRSDGEGGREGGGEAREGGGEAREGGREGGRQGREERRLRELERLGARLEERSGCFRGLVVIPACDGRSL